MKGCALKGPQPTTFPGRPSEPGESHPVWEIRHWGDIGRTKDTLRFHGYCFGFQRGLDRGLWAAGRHRRASAGLTLGRRNLSREVRAGPESFFFIIWPCFQGQEGETLSFELFIFSRPEERPAWERTIAELSKLLPGNSSHRVD